MRSLVVVEILEVGTKGLTPVELKGFSLLRSVYAAGAIVQGHEEIQEGSIIKRAGLTKEGKSPFEMEEGDLSYGVTMETGYSAYTKKARSFIVLAKPRTITGLTTDEVKKISLQDLF